jgi:hypothetical protein
MITGQSQGFLAVAAGAAVIVVIRQIMRFFRKSSVRAEQLKSECVKLVALSEDLQDRISRERHGAAVTDEVYAWDVSAYRRARRRLGGLAPSTPVQMAIAELDETRADLKAAWRRSLDRSPEDREDLTAAMQAHSEAIENFATSSSIMVRVSWPFGQSAETA